MTIRFENVCYHYNSKLPQNSRVLKQITFKISDGEFIGIIGPSGSGKTTLLQHFTGLLRPTSGKIYFDEQDIWSKNYPLNVIRKEIGLVFQFPETQLFEETVYADVAFGPRALQLSDNEVEMRVTEALKLVGMTDEKIQTRSPHQLSEGEKRRVAIAGVLAMAPKMLILDEPTACLDPAGVKLVIQILKHLHKIGTTIIMITHNMDVITELAQRIILLYQGEIFYDGFKNTLFMNEKLLQKVDLETPRIIRLCELLYKLNILTHKNIYTVNDLKREIKNFADS